MQRSTHSRAASDAAAVSDPVAASSAEVPDVSSADPKVPTATEAVFGWPGWLLGPSAVLVVVGWLAYLVALAIGAIEL